jgi:subtilisin family serine protease
MPSKKFPDPPSAGQARLARGWLAVLGCLVFPYLFLPAHGAEPVVVRPAQGPAYRADRILVVPKAGRDLALRRLHTQNRSRVVHHFRDLGGVQVIEIPAGSSALDYVDRYQKSGEVEAAHVDHWFEPAALPNDPLINSGVQWHLNNTGLSGGVPGADIHASMGWDILHEATNIIVAVIDSGLRLTHEDLAGNLWTNPAEIPDNEMDDDGNGIVDDIHGINAVSGTGRPEDDAGHGTHVAGILGAVGNNGLGVCGVAWKLQLMPCKFLSANGGSESGLLQCLEYARSKGAKIINCSFVAPPASISPTLSNAFWTVRNAGIIVVAAAGNRGVNLDTDPEYPASFGMDNIIVVTATTRTDSFGDTATDRIPSISGRRGLIFILLTSGSILTIRRSAAHRWRRLAWRGPWRWCALAFRP